MTKIRFDKDLFKLDTDLFKIQLDKSVENVTTATKRYIWKQYKGWTMFTILLGMVIFFVVAAISKEEAVNGFIAGLIPFIILYRTINKKVHKVFMQQFALANNFIYKDTGSFANEKGSVFKKGSAKQLSNLIEGEVNGIPLRLFNYQFKIGSGKNSQIFKYTIFDLEFNSHLPRMLLDAINIFGRSSFVGSLKKLKLESNEFNKHFSLYITPGHQIEALQIFTPDLMQELLDLKGKYDLEIVGNQLYVYANRQVKNKKNLNEMFKVVSHLIHNVRNEIERMHRLKK
jgi:hypothetical protein